MIVTITANPCLDKTLSVPQLHLGEIHRARMLRQELGGKGINVTRALAALGIPSKALTLVGGITGQAFKSGLAAEGFDVDFIDLEGETRQTLLIFDEQSGQYTKINETGPTLRPESIAALQARVAQLAHLNDFFVLSGSLPPGAPDDFYAALIQAVQKQGAHAILDSSGVALRAGMLAHPYGVKVNSEEAAGLLQCSLDDHEAHCNAVQRLIREYGAEVAAITRGAQGIVLALKAMSPAHGRAVAAIPPAVSIHSTVAAGDSALAGMLWGLLEQGDAVEIARRAVACGTATATQEGSAVGRRALVEELMAGVIIRVSA
jgi:1-phosphofructokinase family hexose kinase